MTEANQAEWFPWILPFGAEGKGETVFALNIMVLESP